MSKFKEFEKRYGKLPGDDKINHQSNQNDKKYILVGLIIFIFQLFITGPNKNYKNPLVIVSMGLVLLTTNTFFLFNESIIKSFISFFDFGVNMKIFMTAVVYIFLIVQFLRGIWIIGGWNQSSNVSNSNQTDLNSITLNTTTKPYNTQSTNELPNAIEETYHWMNSQMQSMSNKQREDYLKNFYSGIKK